MIFAIPANLQKCEFSRLRFLLEFQESVPVGEEVLLRLRRDLRQAARAVLGRGERFDLLFDPPVAADPVAQRRFQRPGPSFVLLPPVILPRSIDVGEYLSLSIVFWGRGRQGIADFIRVMQTFGAFGLHRGEGRFELISVEGDDPAGNLRPLWWQGVNPDRIAAPVHDARWWLETALPVNFPQRLEFLTPARIIAAGRPLFRPNFAALFPFMLRRVTSMLHAHCGVEVIDDPRQFIARAMQVDELENTLLWRDWRVLEGDGKKQQLGGVAGTILLGGEALYDFAWVLKICTLMNLGKGAAYAAGSLDLVPSDRFQ